MSTALLRFHAKQLKCTVYASHRRRLYYGLLTRIIYRLTPATDYNVLGMKFAITCALRTIRINQYYASDWYVGLATTTTKISIFNKRIIVVPSVN